MNRISGTTFRANAARIDNSGFDVARNRSYRGSLFALAAALGAIYLQMATAQAADITITPGNRGGDNSTAATVDATHGIQKEDEKPPQRDELKAPLRELGH